MKSTFWALAAAVLLAAVPANAETLTSDAIVSLSQAGVGDAAIIAKIVHSDTRFDLSTEQLIALRKQGVSGPVLAAMMGGATPAAAQFSTTSADPMVPHPSGVYLIVDESAPRVQRIEPTVTNQAKTGGIIGYALTSGIASMSVKAVIQNASARVKAPRGRPVFYFFFDESNAVGPQLGTWASGTAAQVTAPSEFTLIRLSQKDGRREARVGSMNIGGAKTGVMDKDRIPFDFELVRPGVFKVTPSSILDTGEYGFIYSIEGTGAHGAITARVFDFSIS